MTVTDNPFILRPALAADHDAIADLWHRSASLPDVGPPAMPTRPALRARVETEMAAGWVVTLAEDGEGLAGFLALRPKDNVLAELFLRPDCLGRGLGRVLIEKAKADMPQGFTLYTTATNARARRFYEHHGLVMEREAPHPRGAHRVVYYRWSPA